MGYASEAVMFGVLCFLLTTLEKKCRPFPLARACQDRPETGTETRSQHHCCGNFSGTFVDVWTIQNPLLSRKYLFKHMAFAYPDL